MIFGSFLIAVFLISMFPAIVQAQTLEQNNNWDFSGDTRTSNSLTGSTAGYYLTAGSTLYVTWSAENGWMADAMGYYLLNSYQLAGWQMAYSFYHPAEHTYNGYIYKGNSWGTTLTYQVPSTDTYYVIFICRGSYFDIVPPSIHVISYLATVYSPPQVSISPSNVTMDVGQLQLFTSTVSGGTSPYTYQWYLDEVAFSGATSSTWAFTSGSAGIHVVNVKIGDSAGYTVYSNFARIDAQLPPIVSISPSTVVMDVGQSQLFTSTVIYGTSPYSYQWYLNGAPISGATSSSWVFTPPTAGSYIQIYVIVTDSVGVQATSNVATVTVNLPLPLSVSISPTSVTMDKGQSQLITSSVAGGTPPYSYGWYLADTPDTLINSHTASLDVSTTNKRIGDGPNPFYSPGSYTVYLNVTDSVGASAISNTASITINPAPSVSISPTSVTMSVGQSQQFTSSVSDGSPPYSSQWCLNGVIVSGATSPAWTFTPSSSGSYSVYLNVTDNVGFTVESNTASVTVGSAFRLTVSSAHGSPSPSVGDHLYSEDSTVACSVTSPVTESGTVYTCTGWTGTGSVPSSGTGSSVSFTISQDSTITWNWHGTAVQRKLTVGSVRGSPSPAAGDHLYDDGTPVTCSISSPVTEGSTVWTCTGWSGSGSVPASGSGTTVAFTITHDSTITWNWIQVAQRSLTVSSTHDSPNPSVGVHTYNDGSSITCSVSSPVTESTVSYTCTGWSGTGSVPSSGSGTYTTFTITQDSTLTWNWIVTPPAQVRLTVSSAHDSPNPSVGDHYYSDGQFVTCAVSSPVTEGNISYVCTGWSGTGSIPSSGTGTSVTFTISQNSIITWNWQGQVEPSVVDWWPDFQHDAPHTGHSTSAAPHTNQTLWTYRTASFLSIFSPIVADGMVFACSDDADVYALNALNASTGTQIWNYKTGDSVYGSCGSPAFAEGMVYMGSGNRTYALNASNGALVWKYTTGGPIQCSPAIVDGKVYIGSTDSIVYSLNASTGTQIWNYKTGSEVLSSPAVANGVVYVGSCDDNVYALNASTGAKIWNYTTHNAVYSSPAVANGIVYVGSADGKIYALNAATGTLTWDYRTNGIFGIGSSSPAVNDGKVFVGAGDGNVYALNASTGALVWNYTTGGYVESSPALADGKVFIGSTDGNVYALNASTGAKIWNYRTGYGVDSSPAVADGRVYVSSFKWLYAFGARALVGDLNSDEKVGLADLVILAQAYGSKPGDSNWNPNADIDGNGIVGLSDLVALAQHYGQH